MCVKPPRTVQLNERESCVIIHLNVSVLKSKFLVHELFSTSEIRKPVV